MMSRQTPRATGCTSTLRSPASVVLVVSALAATGCVSKPTLEMFQAASPYVVATARVASQGHPGLSGLSRRIKTFDRPHCARSRATN